MQMNSHRPKQKQPPIVVLPPKKSKIVGGRAIDAVRPWSEASSSRSTAASKRKRDADEALRQNDLLWRRVEEVGSQLSANTDRQPAVDRLAALAARVRQRLEHNS